MGSENRTNKTAFEDLMLMLFAILLVGNAVEKLPATLSDHLGVTFGGQHISAAAALSLETPLGTKVSTTEGTPFYNQAGPSGTKIGEFKPGTSLVLAEGPETMPNGERWWRVEDPLTGLGGWVPEKALVREGVGGINEDTKLGTKVRALMDTSVWRKPGGLDKLADIAKGATGKLTQGPEEKNGSRWWFFDSDESDKDGWLPEAALLLAGDKDWEEGSSLKAAKSTDMYDKAGGGRPVGYLSEGEKAKVIGGPLLVGDEFWWLVEDEDGNQGWVPESALEDGGVRGWFSKFVATLLILGTIITIALLGGIVYVTMRTNQIRAREAQRLKDALPKKVEPKRNERWDKVIEHSNSENPNDWRLAIIEADIMLDEVVTRMGYTGTTLGDRLKQVARGDLQSIDNAWEAHRVRNQIAHQGSDYILTQREAQHTVQLYSTVFEELKYI